MIGAWKNFDELEDSITLDELFDIYGTIIDQESEQFKRDASLQGVRVPEEPEEEEEENIVKRVQRKIAEESGDTAQIARANFGDGQGYQVIGG